MPVRQSGTGGLKQLLATTVAENALVLQAVTESPQGVEVVLKRLRATSVLNWLETLEDRYGVEIQSLQLQVATPAAGMIAFALLTAVR